MKASTPDVTIVTCTVCVGTWPETDRWIADVGITKAYLFDDQFFPGWTVLVLNRHATELFDLTREERGRLIEDLSAVATALALAFEPVKLNYELLGNQTPHIHWHVIPRLADDPALREPVWRVAHDPLRLTASQRQDRIARIQTQLTI